MVKHLFVRLAGVGLALVLLLSGLIPSISTSYAQNSVFTVTLAISGVSFDSGANSVTVTGTVTCSQALPFLQISTSAVQSGGGQIVQDARSTTLLNACNPEASFSVTLQGAQRAFHLGPAVIGIIAIGCDNVAPIPRVAKCTTDQTTKIVILHPSPA